MGSEPGMGAQGNEQRQEDGMNAPGQMGSQVGMGMGTVMAIGNAVFPIDNSLLGPTRVGKAFPTLIRWVSKISADVAWTMDKQR